MQAIQKTQFFAKKYRQLQGLRGLPAALGLLLITLWANNQHGPQSDLTLPLIAAAGCILLYIAINYYYNHTFGKVKRKVTSGEMYLGIISAVLALAAYVLDTSAFINISLLGIIFSVTFLVIAFWYYRPLPALFVTHLVVGILFAGLSVLPIYGLQEWWQVMGFKSALLTFTFLFGVLGIVSGIFAHVYFVRSLPPQEVS